MSPPLFCSIYSPFLSTYLISPSILYTLPSLRLSRSQGCVSSPGWYLLSWHFFAKRRVVWQIFLSFFHLFLFNGGVALWFKNKCTLSGHNSASNCCPVSSFTLNFHNLTHFFIYLPFSLLVSICLNTLIWITCKRSVKTFEAILADLSGCT